MTDDNFDEGIRALDASTLRLLGAVGEMSERLDTTEQITRDLAKQQKALEEQQKLNQRRSKQVFLLALSIVLDVALSIALAYFATRIDRNGDRIDEQQQRTSNEVLCPLYIVLRAQVDSIDPKTLGPKDRREFEMIAPVITRGYEALDCKVIG